jgi:hypothetical protein
MGVRRKRGCVALLLGFGLSLLPEVLNHVITSNANWVDLLFQWMGAPPNCPYSFTDSLGNNAAVTLAVAETAGTVTLTWISVTAFTASRVYMARYVGGGV